MEECVQNGKGGSMCPCTEEVRHASRNADSACPFLYWRDGKKGHAGSAFRDACRTSSGHAGPEQKEEE